MILKASTIVLLAATMLSSGALAQSSSTNGSAATKSTTYMHKEGQWRTSKLVGLNVYNNNNEKIGDINEIILDKSGKVDNVILGVGGFLGMGTHYVAVSFDKLKWEDQPARTSSTNSTTTTGMSASNANRTAQSSGEKWYPDHAVYDATKDQLKTMPEFKY